MSLHHMTQPHLARGQVKKTIAVAIYSLIDIGISTVLFAHGTDFKVHFTRDVYSFDIRKSLFDLWVLSLLRTCFLLGGVLAVQHNPRDASTRIKGLGYLILAISSLSWTYPVVKMLMYIETVDNLKKVWFWSFFAWSVVSAPGFYGAWSLIGSVKWENSSCVNATDEERKPLIGGKKGESDEGEKKKEDEKSTVTVWKLISHSKPDIHIILTAFTFLVAASVAEVFTPYYTGQVINGIAIEKSRAKFVNAIIYMTLISLGSAFASGMRGGFFKVAMSRLNIRIRKLLFSSIIKQEIGFFDKIRTGDLTSRLTSDTTTMSDTLSLNVNVFLRSMVKIIGVVVFMFKLSWQLSMVTVIGTPIITGFSQAYGAYYEKLSKKVQDSLAKANEVAEETCSSMRTVRSFANENAEAQRYSDKLAITYKLQIKEAIAYAGYMCSNETFSLTLIVATLYYGGHLVITERLTGGELVSFILYQLELGYAIESIGYVYTGLMQAVGASNKVYIDRKPDIPNSGKLSPATLEGRLDFKDVTFAYPTRPEMDVLKNVSFSVSPGEVVALVGPSGSGKSSCINLLEHFYETKGGTVLLDDVPINEYDHKYLHNKISLVGQEPVLYARSIKENISYGMENASVETIEDAAKLANAHQFITEMTEKYNTETGEKGLQLSGGQKQRIAIARALIRNPTVLLLDEATSALDAESEHLVQQAIHKNLKGRSVIIIAHRLSTVERADRIIVIEKGCVKEQGTHKDLLAQRGLYAKLVERQIRGFQEEGEGERGRVGIQDEGGGAAGARSIPRLIATSPQDHGPVIGGGAGSFSRSPSAL